MRLPYGRGAYQRTRGNLPSLDVVNLFVEATPADAEGIVLQSRKGLVEVANIGSGPIRGVFRKDGVFDGDRFVVSGNTFYRGDVALGVIAGTGVVSIAASDLEVLVTAGSTLYSYDGTDFVAVEFPNDADVQAIAYTAGYFIALRAGTGEWYFSAVEDGRDWADLDFATAENEPDALLDVVILDGILVLLGTKSIEFWALTGNADLPYAPIQQRVFEQGVIATGCAVAIDNTFFWIGSDKITYRNADVPQAIADDGIVEKSVVSTSWRLFIVEDERHKFLHQRHDDNTMVFDITTGQWHEARTYARANYRAGPGLGDDQTGQVWELSGYLDNGGPMERVFRAGTQLEGPFTVNSLRLSCEVGTTEFLTGDYVEPLIEMRDSRDAGNTWSEFDATSLGEQGQYRERVEWRALGMFDDPGLLFEFRVTAPVSVRFSNVSVNVPGGGRSR